MSKKYSTLAKLSSQKYRSLIADFPSLPEKLKEGIYTYKDSTKRFLKRTL